MGDTEDVDTASVVAISDADRRDRNVPEWRRQHGKNVLALCDALDAARAEAAEQTRLLGVVIHERDAAEVERDRYREALTEIATADPADLTLDPTWAQRIAWADIAPKGDTDE